MKRLARVVGTAALLCAAAPLRLSAAPSAPAPLPAALAHGSRARGFEAGETFPLRAVVGPSPARLGQRLTYRAHVIVTDHARAVFAAPDSGGAFTWGAARMGRVALAHVPPRVTGWTADSVWLEIPLQVFATGVVSIPGPAVRIVPAATGEPMRSRFPTVHLLVLPTITAADSDATLRPVHGPLGAPWWERVDLRLVALVALALAVGAVLVARARRRRPVPAGVPAARGGSSRDPATEALAALARLRARHLPEHGAVGEHAFELSGILRRFLEATQGTPRPGDTSGELVTRLRTSRLAVEDLARLEGLLGLWDRVKFARAPLSAAEAGRCEDAVEELVRRRETREVA